MQGEGGPGPGEHIGKHRRPPGPDESLPAAEMETQATSNAAELRLAQLDGANRAGEVLPADLIGRYQAELGQEWAAAYTDMSQEVPPASAELALRNPQVYMQDSRLVASLPPGLRERWNRLDAFAQGVASRGETRPKEWSEQASGLDKVQSLVESGEMSPSVRGGVGDVIRESSDLFADSVVIYPGNLKYLQGNVLGAASSLENLRRR
jgi:hypothetical protein